MARPKRVTVHTWAPGPSAAARAELWAGVDRLLVEANQHPFSEPQSPRLARELHRAFTLVSAGSPGSFQSWPVWAAVAFTNLVSIVKWGGFYLRRCPTCDNWFLARHAGRRTCYRKPCQNALAAKRQAKARRKEQAEQRRARVTVKGTPRTN